MGKFSIPLLTGLLTAGALMGAASMAQTTQRQALQAQTLDLSNLRVAQTNETPPQGVIDFENAQGPAAGVGIQLTNQYEASHGVSFGRGASIHFCARVFDDVNASLCPYPSAASGQRAAVHDVRAGGPSMVMRFSRPVDAVSMRINPTGGAVDEIFVAELTGFDARGRTVANNTVRFFWRQDAFAWPTSVALTSDAGGFARVAVQLRRVAQNNQPVRFLIDDLSLSYSAPTPDAPVLSALTAERAPPAIADAEIVQSPEDEEMTQALRLYPAATRVRTAIDWDAVDVTLGQQAALSIGPAAHNSSQFTDRATLPILLPSRADNGSLTIVSEGDSYHADFSVGGRDYSLYGTRVLTVINPAAGAPPPGGNVKAIMTNYALIASFSVYGASYTLTRYCRNDSVAEDPSCHNRDEVGDIAREMVVAVGAAGRARP